MRIHSVDITIIVLYMVAVVVAGVLLSRRARQNLDSYFLGGKSLPWYLLGVSNASGMFDITGTMWMVYILFACGLKSVWIPWLWPSFNQIFLMVFLAAWLRRSNVLTGAEWIRTRFGRGRGSELSHISVVVFAIVSVIGFLSYAFKGIGKFAVEFFPWDLSASFSISGSTVNIASPDVYALIFMSATTIYVILGGMFSVVITDLIQFTILTIVSVCIAWIAVANTTPDAIAAAVPEGWTDLFFGRHIDLDWSKLIPAVNDKVSADGYSLFGIFFMMILFKGILSSLAGPLPNYDMQRILAARSPKEAAMMSGFVSVVLYIPRYLMIAGITVLALVFFSDDLRAMGDAFDIERVLPFVISNYIPVGLKGFLLAGLLAAFMSTFDSTVNAGAAYLVNDVYKRYVNPRASDKKYVYVSYLCSIAVVAVGIVFGFMIESIDEVLKWITAGLGAGYIASNLLKWFWWRLNGYGYFAGMIVGTVLATLSEKAVVLVLPRLCERFAEATENFPLVLALFPIVVILSGVAAVVTSMLTQQDDEKTVKGFYEQVRPWGFWGPVCEKVTLANLKFRKNTAFKRDTFNILVGIIWHTMLAAAPIYLVIRRMTAFAVCVVVLVVTSILLKRNWLDKLEET
ncbi:MAG: Na+:solute symporter [Phycisphaerales bacterium]|nr:MAG: Na+:solute symporter [Phycisphaerales bacterium]